MSESGDAGSEQPPENPNPDPEQQPEITEQPEDPEQEPEVTEQPEEPEQPEVTEQPEDSDVTPEGEPSDTDPGLEEVGDEDAELQENPGIMLMAAIPDTCVNGHQYEEDKFLEETGVYSCDASGHTMLYEVIQAKKCKVCNFYDPDSYEVVGTQKGDFEGHNWSNADGMCAVCGYDCEHPDVQVTEGEAVWYDDSYYPVSETEHEREGYKPLYYECTVCHYASEPPSDGEFHGDREYTTDRDVHHWDENNKCEECGYTKPEEGHVHDWQSEELERRVERWEPSPEGCVAYGITVDYSRRCLECGVWEDYSETRPDGSIIWDHSVDNSQGICVRCGYKVECAHEHKTVYNIEQLDVLLGGKLQYNGNGTHSGKFVQRVTYGCQDCGYEWTETQVVDGIQACSFDDWSGKCICGGVHTEHVWSGKDEDTGIRYCNYDAVTDDGNGKTHTYPEYTITTYKICSICGKEFDEQTHTEESYTEPHWFVEGSTKCNICGGTSDCDHDIQARHADSGGGTYKDAEKHYINYDLDYYCTKCGAQFFFDDDAHPNEKSVEEPHTWRENGICSACGAVKPCEHEKADRTKPVGTPTRSYAEIPGNDLQHQVTVVSTYECPTCLKTFTETTTEMEAHHYADGKCTDAGCGHVCAHSQVAADAEPVKYDVLSCKSLDDVWHSVTKDLYYDCACHGQLVKHVVEAKEKHEYTDGECFVKGCGHVCEHSNKVLGKPNRIENEKPVAVDDDSHSTGYKEETPWTCPDCTLTGTAVKNFPTGEPVKHNYVKQGDEYVCSDCGHTCEHTGVKPVVKTDVTYPTHDDKTHTSLTVTVTTIACTHGHDAIETKTEATGEPEEHSYDANGVCTVCGHPCSHEAGEEAGEPVKSDYKRVKVDGNDRSHSVTYTLTTDYTCKDCHKVLRTEVKENQVEPEMEAHSYDANGKCKTCGYECGHSEKATNVGVMRNVSYKSNGSKGHTVTYDLCDEIYCTICGKIVESTPTDEGLSEAEAHSFKGSKCKLCGYTKPSAPAATPTPAPTATPAPTPEPTVQPVATDEPVFEEVTPEEPVHGVTADSSTRMGTALGAAVTEIEKEYGPSTQLNIQNAEKVLPEKEYATFETLPAQEQIMVLVAVLSGESEAEHGVDELGMTLSNDAEQLIVNLQDWMQGMTAEESAAFMDLVKEYFTVEGEDDHLVITLEIRTESGVRYERYGFDLVDGVWVFQKLEVAEIPAAA